jgi:RNA polymerase sigma-70 factor, ECF subfamily
MTNETDDFVAERPRLLGLAYRITGSRVDAEDVVQEAWLRWNDNNLTVDRPQAWLTTVTARLALDRCRKIERQRLSYVGPWLPEPVRTALPVSAHSDLNDPAERVETLDTLRIGLLVLLDELNAIDRVIIVLVDVLALSFAEVAEVVDRSSDACRQIAVRARRRLHERMAEHHEIRRHANSAEAWRLAGDLLAAIGTGDPAAVVPLLTSGVCLTSDGGPHHRAARRPVVGPERVARFMVNVGGRMSSSASLEPCSINGSPGIIVSRGATPSFALVVEASNGIDRIWIVVNPDKLRGLAFDELIQ